MLLLLALLCIKLVFGTDLCFVEKNACEYLFDYPIKILSNNCYVDLDVLALTPFMILRRGFKVVSYNVTTPDGYILELFRIPPRETDYRKNKQPVLLEHGLFHDSSSWTFVGNRSLAFKLADLGYDVWIANQRGTRYSRAHTNLKSTDYVYWTFSLDEVAAFDVPTILEKVANITRQTGEIIYIGHSRGTTLVFMYASQYPEHAQKFLKAIIAFCPIVYFDAVGYMKDALELIPSLGEILLALHTSVIFYNIDLVFLVMYETCSYFPYFCRIAIDLTSGLTFQFLPEDLLVVYTHSPSSESVMLIMHYAQLANSKKFQKFDFGINGNRMKYQQDGPPEYNLTRITVPVYMFYGENDIFITKRSVEKVYNGLESVHKGVWKIPLNDNENTDQFSHNDFIWAKDLDIFLYNQLFLILNNMYSNNNTLVN